MKGSFRTEIIMEKALCYQSVVKSSKELSKTVPKMVKDGSKPLTGIKYLRSGETTIDMERELSKLVDIK
jgi:hypothetical protein